MAFSDEIIGYSAEINSVNEIVCKQDGKQKEASQFYLAVI